VISVRAPSPKEPSRPKLILLDLEPPHLTLMSEMDHFVADSSFENSRNPRGAAVVVEAVMEHMRQCPHESLGVVTLNFEQRELVEELLDRRLREHPAAIAYQEKMKGGQETLSLVKTVSGRKSGRALSAGKVLPQGSPSPIEQLHRVRHAIKGWLRDPEKADTIPRSFLGL
jgi:hypothetical protein